MARRSSSGFRMFSRVGSFSGRTKNSSASTARGPFAPTWCVEAPQLTARLNALTDPQLHTLLSEPDVLTHFMAQHMPTLDQLWSASHVPACDVGAPPTVDGHFIRDIPGRKWQQIEAFAQACRPVDAPLLDWCGGKGHLGRLLGRTGDRAVTTLEQNAALCEQGRLLASRARQAQDFIVADALAADSAMHLAGKHGVALHACGQLHRTFIRAAIDQQAPAIDVAPCCYYHQAPKIYEPLGGASPIALSRDDLRLAVTETVTSSARVIRLRDKEMAWKLSYDLLRREVSGHDAYVPQRPIPKAWLTYDFASFCSALAARDNLALPGTINWIAHEKNGWERQAQTMRLALARVAFRRSIEVFLVLDMALSMSHHGYRVRIGTFCDRKITPRNILISARA